MEINESNHLEIPNLNNNNNNNQNISESLLQLNQFLDELQMSQIFSLKRGISEIMETQMISKKIYKKDLFEESTISTNNK